MKLLRRKARSRADDQSDQQLIAESRAILAELNDSLTELRWFATVMKNEVSALTFMTLVAATEPAGKTGIYDAVGGEAGVRKAVVMLYERVMNDEALAPFFAGINMLRIRQRQVEMFMALFGINDYQGISLHSVHAGLDINVDHFARLLHHVEAVLVYMGSTPEQIAVIMTRLNSFRDDIAKPAEVTAGGGSDGAA